MQDGIFVSYSHKDVETVKQIVKIIKKSGKKIWFDQKLRGGENYFSAIANEIINNKYFVFIVSDNSVESDWCLRELEFAASEKRKIVAIWLDNINISPRIKLIIQNTHYINWYSVPEQLFSQSIDRAFGFDFDEISDKDNEYDYIIPKNKKYFLNDKDILRLQELLCAEKNEKFDICFEPENANLLGMAYELGVLVECDFKRASLYYKASEYADNPDGQYLYFALKRQQEPTNAEYLSNMLDAAERGSVTALTCVGDNYYFGENGLPVDKSKAYEYFERAAKLNGTVAMYYTAYGYRKGECLKKDYEIAYMYVLRSKSNGFPRAYRLLAFMYEDGHYVEKDLHKAIEMYDEAIKKGDYLSYCYQGYVYGELGQIEKKVELYKKAVELAEENKIKSGTPFYRMAVLYDDGMGVEKDYTMAVEYYFKAVERNHADARKWVVDCISKIDSDKKMELLEKAFNLKCKNAAYVLGMIEGDKRKSEKEKLSEVAIKYFEAGAEQGDMRCLIQLITNYSFVLGNGEDREDRLQAIKWLRFFFANADKDFVQMWRERNLMSAYYYAYAIELDYDPDVNMPDREFVLYNFEKSLEESPKFLANIISFAIDGYLFPDESDSGLVVDVYHAEELLALCEGRLNEYYEYLKDNEPDEFKQTESRVKELLKKGYDFIYDCYKTGKYVSKKDKEKAQKYRELGNNF